MKMVEDTQEVTQADRPVALVTGAASGIGAAIARDFAESGWRVAGFDLKGSDTELACTGDISALATVDTAVRHVENTLGPISCLVNAAGYYETIAIDVISEQQWRRMLEVHLGGLVNTARSVLPGMIERRAGTIVAISSELGIGGADEAAHYAAAKGAILGLIRSLALEVAGYGIRVNSVAPGPTDTPLLPADSPDRAPGYLRTLPARRLARADEIARVVRFVVAEGSFMTGEVVSINSGAVI